MDNSVIITVWKAGKRSEIRAKKGDNLRKCLLAHNLSPYTTITSTLNCGGRGLCATCGVFVHQNAPKPIHLHDQLAEKFHYPRLSCQITISSDMVIEIPKKVIWGKRRP